MMCENSASLTEQRDSHFFAAPLCQRGRGGNFQSKATLKISTHTHTYTHTHTHTTKNRLLSLFSQTSSTFPKSTSKRTTCPGTSPTTSLPANTARPFHFQLTPSPQPAPSALLTAHQPNPTQQPNNQTHTHTNKHRMFFPRPREGCASLFVACASGPRSS